MQSAIEYFAKNLIVPLTVEFPRQYTDKLSDTLDDDLGSIFDIDKVRVAAAQLPALYTLLHSQCRHVSDGGMKDCT